MMLSNIVRKKLQIRTASEEFTTASVVARPTPTAPSRALNPFWQLMNTITIPKQNAFDRPMMMSRLRVHRAMFATDCDRDDCAGGRSHPQLVKLEKCLCREHRASECTGDYDDKLRKQSNLDDLIEKQLPPELVRKNTTKRVRRQQHDFAQIFEEREKDSSE